MQKQDALLIFPPVALNMRMPEMGLPQISAWLKSRGKTSKVLDLNIIFLSEWIKTKETDEILFRRWKARSPEFKKLCPKHSFSQEYAEMEHVKQINYIRSYTPLLNPDNSSWQLNDIIQKAYEKDELFEKFYCKYLAPEADTSKLIGFELMNHEQLPAVLYFARRIKEDFPGKTIAAGGPWATASQSALPKWQPLFSLIDFVCLYAGEKTIEAAIDFTNGKCKKEDIPSIVWQENGTVRENKLSPFPDLSKTPMPDYSDLPLRLYPKQCLPARNSSGCVWGKCIFCYHCFPRNKYNERNTEQTALEMKALADKHNLRRFSMADLAIPSHQLAELAKNLIKIKANVTWESLTRADMAFSENFTKLLYLSGCRQLFVGVEIDDPEERQRLKKGIKEGNFEKMLESCMKSGLRLDAFLLNYPGISEEKLNESMRYFEKLKENSNGTLSLVIADFELGRASNSIQYLDFFGITLPENIDTDVRSFSLPFNTNKPWKKIFL